MSKGNILLVDDDEDVRHLLSRMISLEGFTTFEAECGYSALRLLHKANIQVIITDVKLPDINGIDLIPEFKNINPAVEIIVLAAYGSIEDSVKAIRKGAFDYVIKGESDIKLIPVVEKAFKKSNMGSHIERLEKGVKGKYCFENMANESKEIKETIKIARKVAKTDVPVLIVGETGSGKEFFAQSIHNESSRRKSPFVTINCNTAARDLLELEMFGYKIRVFTEAERNKNGLFEEANSGTVFLDEIGGLDPSLQTKLLQFFENKSFIKIGDTLPAESDARIITATSMNLEQEIETNNFRRDLYYRIGVVKIEIPPLRNRKADIEPLARFFINEFSGKMNRKIKTIGKDFLEKLTGYNYPGNIIELRNVIERAMILTDGEILTSSSLPNEFFKDKCNLIQADSYPTLNEIEKQHILKILRQVNGNKTRTAEILGIGLTTLYRKLQTYGTE